MYRFSPLILAFFLTLLAISPALAHGGEDEASFEPGLLLVLLGTVGVSGAAFMRQKAWQLDNRALGIIALTALTACMHILLGIEGDFLLLLNGLGALGLLGLIYLPIDTLRAYQKPLLWGLFGYMIVTLVGYFAMHSMADALGNTLGLITKVIELILIGLLFVNNRRTV